MPNVENRDNRNIDTTFPRRQGALLLRLAGDIKRNPQFLAEETGEDISSVNSVLQGQATSEDANRLIQKMVDIYPFSRLNLEVVRDDTDEGAVVQSSQEAKKTSRVFDRKDRYGQFTPYYEYRDAAMSTLGPFKPEWIRELRVPQTNAADDPDVAYNTGHFNHQLTLFVGPVNLYWEDDNGKQVAEMNTGDSDYGTPYVPHSFTSRDSEQEAYIMAVTFAGKLESAVQQELSVLPPDGVRSSLIDLSDRQSAFLGLFKAKLNDSLLNFEELVRQSGINANRIKSIYEGYSYPSTEEIGAIAGALGVNARDIMPPEPRPAKEVVAQNQSLSTEWIFPSEQDPHYALKKLAGSPKVPDVKAFTLKPLIIKTESEKIPLDLHTPSHTFGYNYGEKPVTLYWEGDNGIRSVVIEPEASFYLKPLKKHGFRNIEGNADLMLVRMGGNLSGDTFLQLSTLPKESIRRLLQETGLWY